MGSAEIQKVLKPDDSDNLFSIESDFESNYNDRYLGSIRFLNQKINKDFIFDIKNELNKEFENKKIKKLDENPYLNED